MPLLLLMLLLLLLLMLFVRCCCLFRLLMPLLMPLLPGKISASHSALNALYHSSLLKTCPWGMFLITCGESAS
jgi:hypothetical protein